MKSPYLKRNVKHYARLSSAINNMCAEHDFSDELTSGVLQALINSVTLIAPPPGGRECVAFFLQAFNFGSWFGILRGNFGGPF